MPGLVNQVHEVRDMLIGEVSVGSGRPLRMGNASAGNLLNQAGLLASPFTTKFP